jgi:hypothetical protein
MDSAPSASISGSCRFRHNRRRRRGWERPRALHARRHRTHNNSRRRVLNVQTRHARLSTADRPDALMIRSCKEWLENVDKDKRNDRGGCANATAERQIIGHCSANDNMPKQSKNKTTASETERRRAEILHNRRVKQILEENERKRTAFDRWSRQKYHLDLNTKHLPYSKRGVPTHRAGLMIKDEDGIYRHAFRRPHNNGAERDIMAGRMHRGAYNRLVYVPEGLPGGRAGGEPVFEFQVEGAEGQGKPKRKKGGKAKRS